MLDFSVTFIITIVNIVVLFFILRVILFKPVTKFMDERAKRVQDSITQAENDKSQAKALLAKHEEMLRAAENEAETIIRAAREHAREEADKIVSESREYAETTLKNSRSQLEIEKKAALAAFRKDAAALVVAAASRLLERDMGARDNLQYAGLLLEEIAHQNDVHQNDANPHDVHPKAGKK